MLTVFFGPGNTTVDADGLGVIAGLLRWARTNELRIVLITGHADSEGSVTANHALSVHRAKAVADALERFGIPRGMMVLRGAGEAEPLVATRDGVVEAENRRVDIIPLWNHVGCG